MRGPTGGTLEARQALNNIKVVEDNSGMAPVPDPLVDEVYAELRRVAAGYVRREQARSVQATELVHEAYLRLARNGPAAFANRAQFVGIAAIAMRRLLIERARKRHAVKRGGDPPIVTLDDALLADRSDVDAIDLLALDRALTRLAELDADQARLVELRFFGGLSVEETAEAMGTSPATVKRHWAMARAWLVRELDGRASA